MKKSLFAALLFGALVSTLTGAETLAPATQTKVDARLKDIQSWAADPVIVSAVKAQNASFPAEYSAMTQEKWTALTVLDPFVRSFNKNAAGQFLKSKKDDAISEAFLNDAAGFKVAFLSKPTGWCHKGKAKHDQPMSSKIWQGPVEVDESTGLQQVQVAVPVFDGDKPIGSLVVGLSIAKLGE